MGQHHLLNTEKERFALSIILTAALAFVGVHGVSAQRSLHITATGDIGVGTSTPAEAFHLSRTGSINARLLIQTEFTNAAFRLQANNGRDWVSGLTNTQDEYNINNINNPGREFTLKANGDLSIAGDLFTSSNISAFPDYVFDEGYPLMPIDELDNFIRLNGHLPNLPSAGDVHDQGGIKVTSLQLQLLEKVEELILYTIQQQDALEAQRQAIDFLKGELEHLRTPPAAND